MAVYVDTMQAQYGRMKMCHMQADTLAELHEMADKIGVARKWFQCPPKASHPHYDICLSKKRLALKYGATEISMRAALYFSAKLGVEWAGSGIQDDQRRLRVRAVYRRTMQRVVEHARAETGRDLP